MCEVESAIKFFNISPLICVCRPFSLKVPVFPQVTLLLLGLYQESIMLFREAVELDPECYIWALKRGIVAGRLQRRLKETNGELDILEALDLEQEIYLLRAKELSDGKSHSPLIHLALAYYWRGQDIKSNDLLEKAEKLMMEAYEMCPKSVVVLLTLGKILVKINRKKHEKFAETCLLQAHELDPNNTMALHR